MEIYFKYNANKQKNLNNILKFSKWLDILKELCIFSSGSKNTCYPFEGRSKIFLSVLSTENMFSYFVKFNNQHEFP